MNNRFTLSSVKDDASAGLVVFLVALPLCLGIALASGAPLFSGLLAGIIGGLVVSLVSGSHVSVSGPAAGLTVIIANAIITLGTFQLLLLAIVLAGIIQLILGFLKAGTIGIYFPSTVIKGMLTAIGLILIIKQIPHAFGYDADYIGNLNFNQRDNRNAFSELVNAVRKINMGATIISVASLIIMITWNYVSPKLRQVPGALIAVVAGILLNNIFLQFQPLLALSHEHLVQLPVLEHTGKFFSLLTFPDLSGLGNPQIYIIACTLALVASLETLLSIEAVDKLDPLKRHSPENRELKAQGIGNIVSGLLGGLPITAVIVRGSANITAGAKTKFAAFFHGILLFAALLFFPQIINQIPLACLAAVLLVVGYKLTRLSLYKEMYTAGWDQFIPFMITVLAILFTDLLIGITMGMAVAIFFILKRNMRNVYAKDRLPLNVNEPVRIILSEEVSFLNKAAIISTLDNLPDNTSVIIDGSRSSYIDYDVLEIIETFKSTSVNRSIDVTFLDITGKFRRPVPPGLRIIQQSYNQLLANNREWAKDKVLLNPDYFTNQNVQSPKYFFITCSDSRMLPNDFTGTGTGEMFVHRNIANLVMNDDKNLMAALQYAIEALKVEHIIICGHYGCGGISGVLNHQVNGAVADWVNTIQETYLKYEHELNQERDFDTRHRKLVELNVMQQLTHLEKNIYVRKAMVSEQKLSLHAWVYDIGTGMVKDFTLDRLQKPYVV